MRSDSNKKKGWREGEEGSGEEEGEEGRELSWQRQPQDIKLEGGRTSVRYKNYSYFLLWFP